MAETLQQTQTLSLRISEVLRKRLEDIRKLTALRKGESVSTSEIAKQLLESAREDRFEVVELLNRPSEALLEIRRKGEAGQMLTRAQWTVVAYFVQQGSEAFPRIPSPANRTSGYSRRSTPRTSSAPSRPVRTSITWATCRATAGRRRPSRPTR